MEKPSVLLLKTIYKLKTQGNLSNIQIQKLNAKFFKGMQFFRVRNIRTKYELRVLLESGILHLLPMTVNKLLNQSIPPFLYL